jgi:outer membrane immunogenic protein
MKRLLLSTTALVTLSASAAYAADLPSHQAAPPAIVTAAPVFTWSGFYAGVNAGYGFADATARGGTFLGALGVGVEADGFIGGAQVGYNAQLGGLVLGAEADIQYSDLKASQAFVATLPGTTLAGAGTAEAELEYFGTVRARLGYAFGSVMPYVTGGIIYGDVKGVVAGSVTGTFNGVPIALNNAVSRSETFLNWVVGAGVEFAMTPNLSLKGEYLYSQVDDEISFGDLGIAGQGDLELHIVRAGLNFRF